MPTRCRICIVDSYNATSNTFFVTKAVIETIYLTKNGPGNYNTENVFRITISRFCFLIEIPDGRLTDVFTFNKFRNNGLRIHRLKLYDA